MRLRRDSESDCVAGNSMILEIVTYIFGHGAGALAGDGGQGSSSGAKIARIEVARPIGRVRGGRSI